MAVAMSACEVISFVFEEVSTPALYGSCHEHLRVDFLCHEHLKRIKGQLSMAVAMSTWRGSRSALRGSCHEHLRSE